MKYSILLAALLAFLSCSVPDETPESGDGIAGGSLSVTVSAQVADSVTLQIDNGEKIQVAKNAHGAFYRYFAQVPEGKHLITAEGVKSDARYAGSDHVQIFKGAKAALLIPIYRQGSRDFTRPLILGISWHNFNGSAEFFPGEEGYITVEFLNGNRVEILGNTIFTPEIMIVFCGNAVCSRSFQYKAPLESGPNVLTARLWDLQDRTFISTDFTIDTLAEETIAP